MSDPKGYYQILGVEKNCNKEEIKQSYKKLALKWHPDRNPNNKEEAEKKFKNISKAYNILIDDNKKKLYDLGISDEIPENFDNFDDLHFPGLFNMNNFFQQSKPKDIILNLEVSLEDIYFGTTIEREIEKKIFCTNCKGKGHVSNAVFYQCPNCKGSGEIISLEQLLPGMMKQMKRKCPGCQGKGRKIENKYLCQICKGDKCIFKKITKQIIINKGLPENSQLTYEQEGYICLDTNKYGNLIVNVNVLKHENFIRIGNHLVYENNIDLVDALCGYSFNIEKLNKEMITCYSDNILSPYNIQIVYNQGMPIYNKDTFGHLIIKSKIIFPKEIPEKRREFLKKTLMKKENIKEESYTNIVPCHILDEKQSNELVNRINNKDFNSENNDDYVEDNHNIECVQM